MNDEIPTPDLADIRNAYAHLSVLLYASRLGIADEPAEVHSAHRILGSGLVRCGAKSEYPELWECRCQTPVSYAPIVFGDASSDPEPAS